MQVSVLYAGFIMGASAFGVWLVVMLRQDHAHRHALVSAHRAQTRAHRRATLAARAPSTLRPTVSAMPTVTGAPSVPVVRAGSFCRVPGNIGRGKDGAALVCASNGNGRPRWRRADVLPRAS